MATWFMFDFLVGGAVAKMPDDASSKSHSIERSISEDRFSVTAILQQL